MALFYLNKKLKIVFFAIILLFITLTTLQAQVQEPRYALVIGNSNYEGLTSLKNPANDAKDMAASLTRLGFKTTVLIDANLEQMEGALIKLGQQLKESEKSIGLFYYAGHGVQSNGVNYLIPCQTKIDAEVFLKTKALSAQSVLDLMQESANKLNLVFLDACRDNPFAWSRSSSRGLSIVSRQSPGSIVVYATSAGSVAQDGQGRNGVFTGELLKNIENPTMDLDSVLNETAKGVQQVTNNVQTPAIYKQYFEKTYLNQTLATGETNPIKSTNSNVQTLANKITNSLGMTLIKVEAGQLNVVEKNSIPIKSFYMSAYELTQLQFKELMSFNPSYFRVGDEPDLLPAEQINWYRALVFCNTLSIKEGLEPVYSIDDSTNPNYWGSVPTKNDEVWNDVAVNWDADGYRLPTEAEWMYAAQGGKLTKNYNYAGSNRADAVAWYSQNSSYYTHNVGKKKPNEIGLFDMSGNVSEWCWDWYNETPFAQENSAGSSESNKKRVVRGGPWNGADKEMTLSFRTASAPEDREHTVGLRLVRTIKE